MPRTLVIVNPRSRNGATARRWAAVERKLRAALGPFDLETTRGPRDAERIAREGVRAGVERIVVAGGDGTLSEVAAGILSGDLGRYTEVGPLPLGTGGDFGRSLGSRPDLDTAIAAIAAGKARRVDAGRASYLDRASRRTTTHFLNIASFGVSADIAERVNRASKAFGGRLSFLLGTLRGIARYRSACVSIRVDGELVHDGPLTFGTAANGRYFGGGMCVAPEARLDDGQLDAVVVSRLTRRALLRKLPSIYGGRHLRDPAVALRRGAVVEADAPPGAVWLEIDGEPLGTLPARFEVLPAALSVLGAS